MVFEGLLVKKRKEKKWVWSPHSLKPWPNELATRTCVLTCEGWPNGFASQPQVVKSRTFHAYHWLMRFYNNRLLAINLCRLALGGQTVKNLRLPASVRLAKIPTQSKMNATDHTRLYWPHNPFYIQLCYTHPKIVQNIIDDSECYTAVVACPCKMRPMLGRLLFHQPMVEQIRTSDDSGVVRRIKATKICPRKGWSCLWAMFDKPIRLRGFLHATN